MFSLLHKNRCRPAAALVALWAPSFQSAHAEKIEFNRDIRPILSDKCFACHGPDKNKRKSGLRLDMPDEVVRPAKSGETAIVPGKPDASELIKRVFSNDPDELMPPPDSHKQLTDAQKEKLKRW